MDGLYGPIYIRFVAMISSARMTMTDSRIYRPRSIPGSLANVITNDTFEQTRIYNAIRSPSLVMLSDWFHMTSEELREVAISADIDTL